MLLDWSFTAAELPQLRLLVEEHAARAGLGARRRGEFVFAVSEIATNAVEHAGGRGRLRLRRIAGELECQVADAGPGFTEAVIPELAPGVDGDGRGGRGLWLARMVTDRLTVEDGAPGAVVTVAVKLPG
ncbi:ATP-binding protein [Yinghuangia seranimata]|nr:ATP-binding protein [Yinghuangia seranimata]MDI2125732.1 ATP-binding protein [Yinghuangia seranimata]